MKRSTLNAQRLTLKWVWLLIGLSALSSQLSTTALAQQPAAVQKSQAAATRDQITADLKFGSGRTGSFLAGSTLSLAGTLSGTPTGGTLNLAALTLTLPATVSGGTSSLQPLDSDLTAIAALTTTSFGRALLALANAAALASAAGLGTADSPTHTALTIEAGSSKVVVDESSSAPAVSFYRSNGAGAYYATRITGGDVVGDGQSGIIIQIAPSAAIGAHTFATVLAIKTTPPGSAGDTGTAGTLAFDANYIYRCTATNTWKRAALSTW